MVRCEGYLLPSLVQTPHGGKKINSCNLSSDSHTQQQTTNMLVEARGRLCGVTFWDGTRVSSGQRRSPGRLASQVRTAGRGGPGDLGLHIGAVERPAGGLLTPPLEGRGRSQNKVSRRLCPDIPSECPCPGCPCPGNTSVLEQWARRDCEASGLRGLSHVCS